MSEADNTSSPAPDVKRTRRRRWPLVLLGGAGVVVIAMGATGLWMARSTGGAEWALRTGLSLAGATGDIEGLQGTFADGLSVRRLSVRHPSADADVEDLKLDLGWRSLLDRHVHVAESSASRIQLALRSSDEPSQPLTSLRLPVTVAVDRLQVGTLEISQDGEPLPVSLHDVDASLSLGPDEHLVKIAQLRVLAPQAEASLQGQARLGVDSPFPADIGLDVQGRQGDRDFDARATATGSLESLAFSLEGGGEGVDINAKGQLALLGGFPLRALALQARGIDPAAWAPGAPRANLRLETDLVVSDEPGKGTDPASVWLRGPFELNNDAPDPVDAGGLPVTRIAGRLAMPIDALRSVDIQSLRIALAGDGRLDGTLTWRRGTDPADAVGVVEGKLEARNIDASRLHGAAMPTRLSGPLEFEADANRQTFAASLSEAGRDLPISLKVGGEVQDQVLSIKRAEIQAGPARANATAELQLANEQRFEADVRLERFDPSFFLRGASIPPASVSATVSAKGALSPTPAGEATMVIEPGSTWNNAPLGGRLNAAFAGERLSNLVASLTAGSNRLQAQGAFGRRGDRLTLDLDAPQLDLLWPSLRGSANVQGAVADTIQSPSVDLALAGDKLQLPGGIQVDKVRGRADLRNVPTSKAAARATPPDMTHMPMNVNVTLEGVRQADTPQAAMRQGELTLTGTMASHRGTVEADFLPSGDAAAARVAASFDGGWGSGGKASPTTGWRGSISKLDASRDPFGISLRRPLPLSFLPDAVAPAWMWEAGATEFELRLPGNQRGTLQHAGSRGGSGRWESAGKALGLGWAPEMLMDAVSGETVPPERIVVLDADWNMRFAGALQGTARIQRRGGDIWGPGNPPVPLGLGTVLVDLTATPTGQPGASRVALAADVQGERLGRLLVKGEAGLQATADGLGLDQSRPAYADADLNLRDLSWLGMFLGDAMDVGGQVAGKVRVSQQGGSWGARGAIEGQGIRVIRVDDGLRLLDGTLKARLEDDRVFLDSLRFPGTVRVRPRDSRVLRWLNAQPDAGSLLITADWSISQASGHATVQADRFPAIQRNDRFVAGSGRVDLDLAPTKMRIAGLFEADAGWINLGTESPPTLSDDVLVVRSGEKPQREAPRGVTFDIGGKLGENFYLQGYGLDTALTGAIRVISDGGAMRSSGTVRTRDGTFSTYGQTLTVRRGAFTFQGPIDDPLLDVVALRIGPAVQAGVQVSGTARRPRIALISEPQVSDVEKLSWLLLGRGPDDGGGSADAGLLLSAATSLLGPKGGEPLTRRLGIDEVGVRSGNVGSSRGLLPERTVAGNSTSATTQLASQFFIIGKRISDTIYVSFEQALAGRDGVVKLSYRLTDRLSVVGKGGTINGMDLLYMVMFDD